LEPQVAPRYMLWPIECIVAFGDVRIRPAWCYNSKSRPWVTQDY